MDTLPIRSDHFTQHGVVDRVERGAAELPDHGPPTRPAGVEESVGAPEVGPPGRRCVGVGGG